MIKTKQDLKECLKREKGIYLRGSKKNILISVLMQEQIVQNWRFVKLLRKTEYYSNMKKSIYRDLMFLHFRRKKNKLGVKLGIEIYENTFDHGINIYHGGNIVVNRNSKIGKNCVLHGSNCIGNNGKDIKCPTIGDNVILGVGAKVIGDIFIANNIKIGAGAVVTKSFYDEGITIVGIPAKKI